MAIENIFSPNPCSNISPKCPATAALYFLFTLFFYICCKIHQRLLNILLSCQACFNFLQETAQSLEMKKTEFDLCESMRLALLSMEQRILQRDLDVEADIPEDSVLVLGDNDLITQVIYNLLENATKFAAPGSTLYLGLAVSGEKAQVTVRNTGHTIPAEEIPLLFERFHKSDKSRSVDKDGYGLGLYIVKTIVEQHKETIFATSEDGVTAFSFTVQLARTAMAPVEADRKH